jgi:hypothetical protein
MDWRKRLREIALAGGALVSSSSCIFGGVPCGNANSDPCICDRPKNNLADKVECDFKMACEGDGGIYEGNSTCQGSKPDAGADASVVVTDASVSDGGGKDAP